MFEYTFTAAHTLMDSSETCGEMCEASDQSGEFTPELQFEALAVSTRTLK